MLSRLKRPFKCLSNHQAKNDESVRLCTRGRSALACYFTLLLFVNSTSDRLIARAYGQVRCRMFMFPEWRDQVPRYSCRTWTNMPPFVREEVSLTFNDDVTVENV